MTTLSDQLNLVTTNEIAKALKMAPRTVAEKVTRRPDFPEPYRIGRTRRWDRKEFIHWMNEHKG